MRDFFQASRGQWMTRRAVHHLDHQDDEFADSNLIIEPFDQQDPVTAKVCESLSFARSAPTLLRFLASLAVNTLFVPSP